MLSGASLSFVARAPAANENHLYFDSHRMAAGPMVARQEGLRRRERCERDTIALAQLLRQKKGRATAKVARPI